jgi:hypothetical protein
VVLPVLLDHLVLLGHLDLPVLLDHLDHLVLLDHLDHLVLPVLPDLPDLPVQVELQEQAEEMVYLRDKFIISTKVRIVMFQVIKCYQQNHQPQQHKL